MATVPTQARIDRDVKEQASALFNQLGIDMSGAVNLFLHQCLLHGGLPFPVEIPHFSQSTLNAMAEAKRISHDPSVPSYDSMDELKKALNK